MVRPTRITVDSHALWHNIQRVKQCAPGKKILAMVKANAYGCGFLPLSSTLDGQVDWLGVASLQEAMDLKKLGQRTPLVLVQGVFSAEELPAVATHQLEIVIHHQQQLDWLLAKPLETAIHVWVKVDTGMGRLGFIPSAIDNVLQQLIACPWVKKPLRLMTHLAHADDPHARQNQQQIKDFEAIRAPEVWRSMANSGAIMALPATHFDVVRPGIMLYGVSPFLAQTGIELGLKPVVSFHSKITAIHDYPAFTPIGYSGTWQSERASRIGVICVGYGDGYPRHIAPNTPVWINGVFVPIVGRVSMDMITIDLTDHPLIQLGDQVELWGKNLAIEVIAQSAHTIAYELLAQITARVR